MDQTSTKARKILKSLPKFTKNNLAYFTTTTIFFLLVLVSLLYQTNQNNRRFQDLNAASMDENRTLKLQLEQSIKELEELQNQDQYLRNESLQEEIDNIKNTYKNAASSYEEILDIQARSEDTEELEQLYADALSLLSQREYDQAQQRLNSISEKIGSIEEQIAKQAQETANQPPENVQVNNTPPGSGYSRQVVSTSEAGSFTVSMVAADLSSTRIIVDTASSSDCANDCPVLSLAEYISRNGAYAGINGTYFCPATYPSCAGKTNSFDLLVMNKDKTYFNSDNNIYSNNPAVIFGDSYIRFVTAVSQWGRDTSPNGVLSNYPLLVFNGGVTFGGDDDPKKGSKGNRSFVANKGNSVYIGVVHSATVAESARVMQSMGMENALNLDDGGSTALWSGGYKIGPGRNLPNVILFVSK